jgi:hypothetical protein
MMLGRYLQDLLWSWHEHRRSKWLEEDPEDRMNAWEYSQWSRAQNKNRKCKVQFVRGTAFCMTHHRHADMCNEEI